MARTVTSDFAARQQAVDFHRCLSFIAQSSHAPIYRYVVVIASGREVCMFVSSFNPSEAAAATRFLCCTIARLLTCYSRGDYDS